LKIKRRVLSCIICFILILGLIPTIPTQAAGDPIYSAVAEQYDAYVRSLGTVSGSDGANVLYSHAIFGRGKFLSMGKDSAFTKAMLRADLMRMAFTDGVYAGTLYMINNKCETLYLAGGCANYSDKKSYHFHVYSFPDEDQLQLESNIISKFIVSSARSRPEFRPNEYDQMLWDVVGSGLMRIYFERLELDKDSIRLKVTLKLRDDFDFNPGQDSASNLGSWLDGKFIDSYSWESAVSFEIALPNTCSHYNESGVYRWEYDGTHMVNVSGEGLDSNTLENLESLNTDGSLKGYYYKTAKPIKLDNDKPWILEFRIGGQGGFVLSSIAAGLSPDPTVYWCNRYTSCMFYYTKEYETSSGEIEKESGYDQYRINLDSYITKEQHTYVIENRISEDGSNMAWLLIDGEEIGAFDDYWTRFPKDGVLVDEFIHDEDPWFDTADFSLNYIFTRPTVLSSKLNIEYLQVWENGKGEPYKYYSDYTTDASCTESAKAVHVCHACGAEYSKELSPALGHSFGEYIPDNNATCTADGTKTAVCTVCGEKDAVLIEGSALGHKEETIPGYAPSCLADGLTDGKRCAVCGETTLAQTAIPALGHIWDGGAVTKAPTTTEAGELTYTCEVCGETKTEEISGIPAPEFEDVPAGSWYYEPAAWAAYKGITSGVTETQFAPAQGCTRAQAVTFLWRAAGEPEPESTDCPFEDVGENVYYRDAVLWAAEQGITSGTGEGEFSPNAVCTRAQIAAFIWRWMGEPESGGKLPFEDAPSEAWYAPAVAWAVETGVTSGVSADSFAPNSTCTRAQIVTFLYRACS